MANLQVRAIDNQLYNLIEKKASMDKRSISQEVIVILKEHLSEPRRCRSAIATEKFIDLCGTWKDDRTPEEIISDLKSARKSPNRFKEKLF